jgi:hypothetical protein
MDKIESELNYLALCLTKWNNGVWKKPEPYVYSEYQEKYNNLLNERKKYLINQRVQMLP